MSSLDEMLLRQSELAAQLRAINVEISEATGLPDDWHIDTEGGPMAGGVALRGPNCDPHRDEDETIVISVSKGSQYGAVFFLVDEARNERSPWIDPEAVRAALRIYDQRNAEAEERRKQARETSARRGRDASSR